MPLYGVAQAGANPVAGLNLTSLMPGDSLFTLFSSADSLTAPQASVAFNRGQKDSGSGSPLTFQIRFASSPTAVVQIQAANTDVDSDYMTVYTSTNSQQDAYTDVGKSKYYRARLLSQSAGGALIVTVNP